MATNHYTTAGWLCFAGAALTLPSMALATLKDIGVAPSFAAVPLMILLNLATLGITVYTLLVFLMLVRDRYGENRGMDVPVYLHLVLYAALTGLAILARAVGAPTGWALVIMMALMVPAAICAIIVGVKVLHLPDDLLGLRRPLGVLMIVGWALPMTWILIPVGMLVGAAATAVMGVVLLRAGRGAAPEFV